MTASRLHRLAVPSETARVNGGAPGVSVVDCGTLTIHSWRDGRAECVALFGELDMASATGLEQALQRAEGSHTDSIVLDLSALEFIDSNGVAAIVHAYRQCRSRLLLLRGPRQVQCVFELTGLDRVLPFANC